MSVISSNPTDSLIMSSVNPPSYIAMKESGVTDDMIRLSVGLEDINDITKDFERGFRAVKKLNM